MIATQHDGSVSLRLGRHEYRFVLSAVAFPLSWMKLTDSEFLQTTGFTREKARCLLRALNREEYEARVAGSHWRPVVEIARDLSTVRDLLPLKIRSARHIPGRLAVMGENWRLTARPPFILQNHFGATLRSMSGAGDWESVELRNRYLRDVRLRGDSVGETEFEFEDGIVLRLSPGEEHPWELQHGDAVFIANAVRLIAPEATHRDQDSDPDLVVEARFDPVKVDLSLTPAAFRFVARVLTYLIDGRHIDDRELKGILLFDRGSARDLIDAMGLETFGIPRASPIH